jgi:hypothetical protein
MRQECFFNQRIVLDVCEVRSGTTRSARRCQIYTATHPLNAERGACGSSLN